MTAIDEYRAALDALIPLAADRAEDMSSLADDDANDGNHDATEFTARADAAWQAVEAARALLLKPAHIDAHVSGLMLDALRLAAERIEMNNYGGEEDEALASVNAAIAAAKALLASLEVPGMGA